MADTPHVPDDGGLERGFPGHLSPRRGAAVHQQGADDTIDRVLDLPIGAVEKQLGC